MLISILSLWTVGKFLNEKKQSCLNVQQSCSQFLSYYYGNSSYYSLSQIHTMKKLYLYFPIYIACMSQIGWSSYLELLKLPPKECYFYYMILLFCGDDLWELKRLIHSNIYIRI